MVSELLDSKSIIRFHHQLNKLPAITDTNTNAKNPTENTNQHGSQRSILQLIQ